MKDADHFLEVYDCQGRFLGIFFFRITLPYNQIVQPWQMFVCFLGIDCTVSDSFHLVLLVIARLKLQLILMNCLCHLVSVLTKTDDILKLAFVDLLSGSQGSPTRPSLQLFQNHSRSMRIRLSSPISYPGLNHAKSLGLKAAQ